MFIKLPQKETETTAEYNLRMVAKARAEINSLRLAIAGEKANFIVIRELVSKNDKAYPIAVNSEFKPEINPRNVMVLSTHLNNGEPAESTYQSWVAAFPGRKFDIVKAKEWAESEIKEREAFILWNTIFGK